MLPLNGSNLVDLYLGGGRGVIFITLNHQIKEIKNKLWLANGQIFYVYKLF